MLENLYARVVEPVTVGTVVEVSPCPVCRGRQARPTFAVDGLPSSVVVCTECGLGFLHPQPSPEEIRSFYPQHYYGETGRKFVPLVEAMVRLVGARHARFWTRGLPAGARILDLGCGRGVLLAAFLGKGFEAHGVEISEAAVEGIDPRVKIRMAWHLREADYPADYFDQILIWHVLEHLPDPRATLEECRRILRPGGRLIVAVPNFSSLQARWTGAAWFHLDLPRHLFHFPLAALERLLVDCGFTCASRHHFSLRQNPFGWVQSLLNRSRRLPRNGLYELLQPQSGAAARLRPAVRRRLRTAYWLGMPPAVGLSLLATLLRQGATVSVVGRAS
ncbi:MAG: class I SAM-dependent methyltransferase [bacterium]|nr:class I SAM-dependent methyltransferase [bacterium]